MAVKFFGRKNLKFWLAGIAGLVLGVLIILAIRFFTYNANHVHYHANFAVYIDGQREQFKGASYYEEETACKAGDNIAPADRAHMHDNINDVVHVHDRAVTWEQFFNNLGWSVGGDFIETRDTLYQNNDRSILHITLNGQDLTGISSIANKVIGDRDKLLLDYGPTDSQIKQEYNAIPSTAIQHDQENDPASCSGPTSTTFSDRLHHLF
ncbi:MAG TPA: hypothetical protein VLE51_01050 [Candidatus Saccharimonadales bacterium]|nr:hypothetical protein [Candidatus Saccharimonadales bacterium]